MKITWDGKNESDVMNAIFEWVNSEWVESKGEKKAQWTSISAPVVGDTMEITLKCETTSFLNVPKPLPVIQTFRIPKYATVTGVILDNGRRWISVN